jgi:quinol monooxygenase YgiN
MPLKDWNRVFDYQVAQSDVSGVPNYMFLEQWCDDFAGTFHLQINKMDRQTHQTTQTCNPSLAL